MYTVRDPGLWELNLQPFCCEVIPLQTAAPLKRTEGKKYLAPTSKRHGMKSIGIKLWLAWVHFVQTAQWLRQSELNMPQPGCEGLKLFDRCVHEGTSKLSVNYTWEMVHHLFGFIILLLLFTKQRWDFQSRKHGGVGLIQWESRQLGLTAALGPPVQWSTVIEGERMI